MERTMFEALAGELLFLPVIFQGLEDEFGVNINAGTVRQIRRAIIEDDMEEFRKVASGHVASADLSHWSLWAVDGSRDIFEMASIEHPTVTRKEFDFFADATEIVLVVSKATRGHPVYVTVYRWRTH